MKRPNIRKEWAGCSNFKERRQELLKAHEEFQKLLDNGYEITAVKKVRRPRIHREKTPRKVEVSIMSGLIRVIVDFSEWQAHGAIGTIIKKIY